MHIHFPAHVRTAAGLLAAGLAFAVPWSAPAAHASVPSVTCDGSQNVVITPGVTDALTQQTGTTAAQLGVYDSLGLGGQDCESTDGSLTGGTFTYTFRETLSCTDLSGTAGTFTGTIDWDNGKNSAVSGTFVFADNVHGDGLVQGTGKISSGEFQGETLTLQTDGITKDPDACERDGVKSMSGSVDVVIGPATR